MYEHKAVIHFASLPFAERYLKLFLEEIKKTIFFAHKITTKWYLGLSGSLR